MKTLLIVATAIGMLGLVAGAVLAQSRNELFSQALLKERTEGNMAEAIKLYETIVTRFPTDRNLVAKALLQIGLCHERQGDGAEARKAFDQVLLNYKDQKEPAAKATARLAELNLVRSVGQLGGIRGRVTDRGQPVFNAQVFAMKALYYEGIRVMTEARSALTNHLGEYDLSGLRPSEYYVAAVVRESATGGGTPADGLHVPIYFPGTPDWQRAKVADVRSGATILNVDIDAAPVPVRRVRGTVTGVGNVGGSPSVTMMERDLPFTLINLPAILPIGAEANGSFETSVPAGSYVFYASQIGGNVGRADVEVRDRDVNGVDIVMSPGLTVSGRLVPPDAGVSVVLGLSTPLRESTLYIGIPLPDGSFTIRNGQDGRPLHKGDYRVSVNPILRPPIRRIASPWVPQTPGNAYVKSIRLGETDVLNEALHLREQPQQALVVVIGANPGTLEGRVLNARKEPVSSVTVVLIPEGGIRFRVDHRFTATDASGRFRLDRIPPGDYRVFAWQGVENGEWQDPDFVRPYESRGKPIHINEGDKVNVEVVAIPPKR